MSPGPGWYQDPQGPPGQLRYFDGSQWTEHRAAAPTPAPYPPVVYLQAPRRTTPDGRPLASWGARLGAQMIDLLVVGVIDVLLSLHFIIQMFNDQLNDDQRWQDAHPGQIRPFNFFAIYSDHWGTFIATAAIGLAVHAIYFMGFWRWKQATPGKMAVGIRIEYRDHTGPLTWGSIVQRWLVQFGAAAIPYLGSLVTFLDGLWPLWDKQSQAIHEKWPKTNVVQRP